MNEAARRWMLAAVRRQPAEDGDLQQFFDWLKAVMRSIASRECYKRLFPTAQDVEDLAQSYVMRLLSPAFRPEWAKLADADIQRRVADDIFGGKVNGNYHEGAFFTEQREQIERNVARLQEPDSDRDDDGEPLYEQDRAAVRRHVDGYQRERGVRPALALTIGRVTAAEAAEEVSPVAEEEEALLRRLNECLADYCEAEWPDDWPTKGRALAAHMLRWYDCAEPDPALRDEALRRWKRCQLRSYEIAALLRISAKTASLWLKEARAAYVARPEAPRTEVGTAERYLLSLRLGAVLSQRRENCCKTA